MSVFDSNPFKTANPFSSTRPFGQGGSGNQQARPVYRQPLPQDEYESVGRQALNAGTSGISHVIGALNKPGDAVRGVLAGKGVGALKNLVPFSDTMGLTGDADHTSGRDLTNKWGLTTKGDKGWGAWGAGLAADVVTDPLTYATFGAKHALTPIGKAVEATGALRGWTGKQMLQGFHGVEPALLKAGQHADDIEHMINQGNKIATGAAANTGVQAAQPMSSLVRIGLPFGGPGVNIGTGARAQQIAGVADAAGDWIKYGNPVGRAVGSLFDPTRHGAVGAMTQRGASKYLDPALQDLKETARFDRQGLIQKLDPIVSSGVFPEQDVTNAARAAAEGVPHEFGPDLTQQVSPAGNYVQGIGQRQLAEARAAGAPISEWADPYAKYVHRSAFAESPNATQLGGKGSKRTQPLLPTTSGANIGRDALFGGIPGGTNRINNWFDRFAGVEANQAPAAVAAIKNDMIADHVAGGHGLLTQEMDDAFTDKAGEMASRIINSNPAHRTTADAPGVPFFSPDLVADVTQRGNQHARTVAHSTAATKIMAENAQQIAAGNPQALIPMSDVAQRLNLQTHFGNPEIAEDVAKGIAAQPERQAEGALVNLYKGLAQKGMGKYDPTVHGIDPKALMSAVDQYGLTREQVEELAKAHTKWAAPEEIKSTVNAFDSATNAFKALAYPIWIPSHVRNAVTAGVNNLRHGTKIGDYLDQLQVMTGRGSRDLSGIHPSLQGLLPADQIDQLRRLQYGNSGIFSGNGMVDEIAGNAQAALQHGQRFTPQVPGSDRVGPHGSLPADAADLILKQGLRGTLTGAGRALVGGVKGLGDPTRRWGQSIGENLGIKGVGGVAGDTLGAVSAGRKVGSNIEDFFRGALSNRLSRQGNVGSQVRDKINALHFDYDALAPFEKNVMRRVMPFYTYARKNLPLQVDTALHQPGILQAQSKPFMQGDADSKGYVPKYLDSGLAIGLGPEEDGHRQYISKLGLPAEEAFEKMHFSNGLPDVRRTALSYLSGTNPLIKGPLEQLFNTQFHTQRQLSDLHAPAAASAIGRMWNDDNPQLLSQIMANSPMTRFISSADKLMDPRKSAIQKAANLLAGVKVSDVDTDKQRAIDTRAALGDMMKAHPNISQYSSFYVKPDDAEKLSPQDILLMRAFSTQQDIARKFAQSRRENLWP